MQQFARLRRGRRGRRGRRARNARARRLCGRSSAGVMPRGSA